MKTKRILLFIAITCGVFSCSKKDPNSPGFEFMPDMYRSPSLDYYGEHYIDGDRYFNAKLPVKGTVPRGVNVYPYPDTPEGYELAGKNLKNPLPAEMKERWEKEGEELYGKYCIHCHGPTGAGDGKVAAKLPGPPPAYNGPLKNLPEGKIFHSITYGKNSMGPHASLLSAEERWKLVYYVQKLQGPKENKATADTTKKIK